jgi:phage baseplate assembly protein gpV
MDRGQAQPRFGVVASVDPARYAVRVMLQPEAVLSGWLPVLTPWCGAGWGMVCPPSPGDQVLVVAQEGDADHGIVIGTSFSDQARAPMLDGDVAPPGEIWLVHRSGSALRLRNDGTVRVDGDLHVTGDVIARNVVDSHGSLDRLRTRYNLHSHASHGARTSLPDQP